jgi:metallo-beta-lactamase class B
MVVADGGEITLGENRFTVLETPGHTWGTASYVYDVKDGDQTHRAITIGGLGLNAIEGPPQVEAFIESLDRMRALTEAKDMGIDVHLTTHGFSNGLDEDRQAMAERRAGEPNVMVDPNGLLAQIEGLRAGAVERLAVEQNK